ncbi:MAG: flagellar protein FlgN [Candidatus Gastranaerophilales bacterium]|nr:flagellar protein FlgN [Candidatus Gastranaerophilales bacterium]
MDKVLELNKVLDEEIEFCENFENLLLQKKELLIHSQASKLKEFDEKIYAAQKQLKELNDNRIKISEKFGNNTPSLSEIISNLNDRAAAIELEQKRKKLQIWGQKINIINKVVNALIEHSLKLIDGNIWSIAKAIEATQTKGDYYNKQGSKAQQQLPTMSAIVEEA